MRSIARLVAHVKHTRGISMRKFCNYFGYEKKYTHWNKLARIHKNLVGIRLNCREAGLTISRLTWNELAACTKLSKAYEIANNEGSYRRKMSAPEMFVPPPGTTPDRIVDQMFSNFWRTVERETGIRPRTFWKNVDRLVQEAFAARPKYDWHPRD